MCMSKAPNITAPAAVAPPPATQDAKEADINAVRRRQQQAGGGTGGIAGGTLLTGGAGGASGANTGAATLLGQ